MILDRRSLGRLCGPRDLILGSTRGEPLAVPAVVQLTGTVLAAAGDTLRIAVRSMRDTTVRPMATRRGATAVVIRDAGTVVSVPQPDPRRTEAAGLLGAALAGVLVFLAAHGVFGLET